MAGFFFLNSGFIILSIAFTHNFAVSGLLYNLNHHHLKRVVFGDERKRSQVRAPEIVLAIRRTANLEHVECYRTKTSNSPYRSRTDHPGSLPDQHCACSSVRMLNGQTKETRRAHFVFSLIFVFFRGTVQFTTCFCSIFCS